MELVNRDDFGLKTQYRKRIDELIELVQFMYNTEHADEPVERLRVTIEQYAEYCYAMGTHEGVKEGFDKATDIAQTIITNGSK